MLTGVSKWCETNRIWTNAPGLRQQASGLDSSKPSSAHQMSSRDERSICSVLAFQIRAEGCRGVRQRLPPLRLLWRLAPLSFL